MALLPGRPRCFLGRAVASNCGQVASATGGPQALVNSSVRVCFRARRPGGGAGSRAAPRTRAGRDRDALAADGRGGRLGQHRSGQGRCGAGQVERDHRKHESGRVGGERAGGQVYIICFGSLRTWNDCSTMAWSSNCTYCSGRGSSAPACRRSPSRWSTHSHSRRSTRQLEDSKLVAVRYGVSGTGGRPSPSRPWTGRPLGCDDDGIVQQVEPVDIESSPVRSHR